MEDKYTGYSELLDGTESDFEKYELRKALATSFMINNMSLPRYSIWNFED